MQQKFFCEERFLKSETCRHRYALRDNWYVVIDEETRRALNVVRRAQRADAETRREFARNPRSFIRNALGDDLAEELIEQLFVETAEYSERVKDVGLWERPVLPWVKRQSDTWIPESFGLKIGDRYIDIGKDEISPLRKKIEEALVAQDPTVEWNGEHIPATETTLKALDSILTEIKPKDEKPDDDEDDQPDDETTPREPIVLIIDENFEEVERVQELRPRKGGALSEIPLMLKTPLKSYQTEGVKWMQQAWHAGQTGVLLADDMGLGKTLQALTFLGWLRQSMDENSVRKAPILVVAPTGLLKNWEQEHDKHLHAPGFGTVFRAYGGGLRNRRQGTDNEITLGKSVIDTSELREADWVLTTFETLRDYQHSFAAIRFATIVFDEVQKIKTPGTVMTHAAKAMNGDFIIALTGTPIENRLADLWCIVDTIEPGFLSDLKCFSNKYEKNEAPEQLKELKSLLTEGQHGAVPIMLRRMKSNRLEGLPKKHEIVRKSEMPATQSDAYTKAVNSAREEGAPGKMLQVLHRLRSISLHPIHPDQAELPNYIQESARMSLTFQILDEIKAKKEKTLIFVESLEMHPQLAGLIQNRYGLEKQPMLISGSVAGPKRQERVNEFQRAARKFDVIILSPRAGGVGITLTAANHVIHLSRWWNPAVEDQCTDRVYRIGQERKVHVYYVQAVHPVYSELSFDIKLHQLLERKRALSQEMLLPPVNRNQDAATLYRGTIEGEKTEPPGGVDGSSEEVNLDDIDTMEPVQFENWVLSRLKSYGFKVNKTPKSWDCGADGLAVHPKTGRSHIIQCKHLQTGNHCDDKAIEELLRAKEAYDKPNADLYVVTNSSGFTKAARNMAEEFSVKLVARDSLINWPNI